MNKCLYGNEELFMRIVRTKAVRTSRRHQTFLQGALILTAGIFLVKVIGAMFKIPLTWIIGEDGLGYFNTAYHFYSPIHSLATAGFPIAISRMVLYACPLASVWVCTSKISRTLYHSFLFFSSV